MPSIANAIAVGIGMDTKQLRKDVNYANRIIGQSKAAFRDLGKTLELINLDYKEGTITQNEYTAAVNKAVLASEKKTAQLKQEAATVKALEAANLAASAAERKRVQDSLGLGSYSGAKPGSATGSGSVNSYLNAGSSKPKNTDSLGLGSYSGAQAEISGATGALDAYVNAAERARRAALDAQAPLSGWANGLKQLGLSKFAQELNTSRRDAAGWEQGLENMAAVTREAAAAAREEARALAEAAAAARQRDADTINARNPRTQLRAGLGRLNELQANGLVNNGDAAAEAQRLIDQYNQLTGLTAMLAEQDRELAAARANGLAVARSTMSVEEQLVQRYNEDRAALTNLIAIERQAGNSVQNLNLALAQLDNNEGVRRREESERGLNEARRAAQPLLDRILTTEDLIERQYAEEVATLGALARAQRLRGESTAGTRAAIDAATTNRDNLVIAERNRIVDEGRQYLQQFENAQQRTNRQIAEARAQMNRGAISAREYGLAVMRIREQNSAFTAGLRQLRGVMLTLVGPLVLVIKAYEAVKTSIGLSAELDAAQAKFRVFTGSARDAAKILQEIRDLSSSSPVSFAGGQRATTTMLQFGVESKNVVSSLKQIAEITGGDTARMESLALAFAQSQAAGRLMGQELLQMVNAGFNPLKIISEQTGESLVELKKRMEDGGVSAEEVAGAFYTATREGGKFYGLLDEIANTTAGKITRAGSELEKLGTAFGNLAKPATDATLSIVIRLVKDATEMVNTAAGFIPKDTTGGVLQRDIDSLNALKEKGLDEAYAKYGGDKEISRLRSVLSAYNSIEQVRKRIAAGKDVTANERVAFDLSEQERNVNKKTKDETIALVQIYQKESAAAADYFEKVKLYLELVEKVGAKNPIVDPAKLKQAESEFTRLTKEIADAKRVTDTFQDSIDKLKEKKIGYRYGDNADRVSLLQEQSAGDERKQIDTLLAQGAAYSQIYAAANQAAQAEADRLAILEDANRAAVFKEEMDNLASQAKYLEEAVSWGKEEARIRQLMRDDGLSRSEAELKRAAEDRLKAEEKIKELRDTAKEFKEDTTNFDKLVSGVAELQALLQLGFIDQAIFDREANKLTSSADQKYGTASAPRAIQAGSAEAFALQAENQAKVISENIRLANRAFTVQKATSEAAKKTSDILDDIKDNLGVLPTP